MTINLGWRRRSAVAAVLSLVFAGLTVVNPATSSIAEAQVACIASSQATLTDCIDQYNAAATGITVTVTFGGDITLTSPLPNIDNGATPPASMVIEGSGHTLDGDSATNGVVFNVLNQLAGDVEITQLMVQGAPADFGGLLVSGGSAVVKRSTFAYNGYGVVHVGDTTVTISDSTIAFNENDGIAIWTVDGAVDLQRSTVAHNEAAAVRVIAGSVSLAGSMIVGNAGVEPDGSSTEPECLGSGYSDLGGNIVRDSSCGTAAMPRAFDHVPLLLDGNGCSEPCTPTVRPFVSSAAVDANTSCGAGLTDQLGVVRTAGKCDAGAVEIGDCATETTVSIASALRFAVSCYNRHSSPETFTITLAANIVPSRLLVNNRITPAPTLHIDGAGHTLTANEFAPYVFIVGNADLRLSNINLASTDPSYTALGVESDGSVSVERATFSGLDNGIQTWSTQTSVVNSTFIENVTGIRVEAGGSVQVEQSTFVNNDDNGISSDGGGVSVVGSLIAGNGFRECIGGGYIDLGGNTIEDETCGGVATPDVAGSFAGLFDNGCVVAPCTPTVALIPGSPAIDAHTGCLAGTTDQRGELRTAGKCDAGAFEFGDIASVLCNNKEVTIDMNLGASGIGTSGDDVILGTPGNDVVDALAGNDTVCAGDGNDTVIGGSGDDTLLGGAGRDVMRGNSGVDRLEGEAGNDRLLGGIDGDTLIGGEGDDYLGGFGGADTIIGGPGNETIFGGFGADTIDGGSGNDVISGLIGNDIINGGDGNDTLNGDRGKDTVNGGAGNDTINGGNGDDILNGDGGDDTVNGGRADDQLSGGGGTNDTCVGNKQNVADFADSTCETIFGVP